MKLCISEHKSVFCIISMDVCTHSISFTGALAWRRKRLGEEVALALALAAVGARAQLSSALLSCGEASTFQAFLSPCILIGAPAKRAQASGSLKADSSGVTRALLWRHE